MRQFWIPIVNMHFPPDGKWISLQFKCAPILNHPETVHVFADSFLMKFVSCPKTALHRCPLSLIMRFFPRGKLLFLFLSLSLLQVHQPGSHHQVHPAAVRRRAGQSVLPTKTDLVFGGEWRRRRWRWSGHGHRQ